MGGGISADPDAPGDRDAALGDLRTPDDVGVRTARPSTLAAIPLARTAVMIVFRP
ncbi:hypothetical protein [Streptomyces sp. NPDC127038]|uniref:hypothetical protein n=1 Tax=Streptomyces sp. NPDC127038 TaxID=3347114 RepID=UPI003667F9D4